MGDDHHPIGLSVETRLTKVEAHYDALAKSLSSGFDEIKQMIRANSQNTRAEIDALHGTLDARTKPQVHLWLQIVGVGITIAVIAGGVFIQRVELGESNLEQRIRENHTVVTDLSRQFRDHAIDGHPHVVLERVRDTERRLGEIEGKRISESDPTQNERLRALEREVFGRE